MRSLVWALFVLSVMATATVTAAAETRLLGPPVANATPLPTCQAAFDPAVSGPCARLEPSTTCPDVGDGCAAVVVNDEMSAEPRAQADATWEAGADAICKQGDPTSMGTQEMCDLVSAFRARQQMQQTPVPSPQECQAIAAPDPRCTGN